MKRTLIVAALALCAATPATAAADDAMASCEEPHEIDRYQLLRRLSLDLRDKIPSVDEYEALDGEEGVPGATIQEYLESDDFRQAMRRYHEKAFWPNVSTVRLNGTNTALALKDGPALRISSGSRAKVFRGVTDATCGDFEQTQFDPAFPGEHRPKPGSPEGWRMVSPYWDPANPVKVCAYDAQETLKAGTKDCKTADANSEKACGCGPNLRFCYGPSSVTSKAVLSAFREQLNRSVDEVVAGGAPYTDLLLSTKAQQNGTIAFWKTNLASNPALALTYDLPDADEEILDKEFGDDTWAPVDRKGLHAGVLTLPGYLLRFQTDRGRANRMRITMTCEYFVPPAKMEPAPGCQPDGNDLTKRCNCQYCHEKLEPLASYFASFAEAGTTFMDEAAGFPTKKDSCVGSASAFCRRFYVTQEDAHNPGSLLALQWADDHPEYTDNAASGPRALAQQIIDDGTFAHCTVRKTFAHFVKRDIRAQGAESDELDLLEELAKGFEQSTYDFAWLVREIVNLPQYRRVR